MEYNEQIWEDLTYDEKQAYRLAQEFTKRTKKQGNNTNWVASASSKISSKEQYLIDEGEMSPGDKIRNSKNWTYFIETWEVYKDYQGFDPYGFIDSVFINLPKGKRIFPAQLRTKKVFEQYKNYRLKQKMGTNVSTEKQIMQHIATSYKFIKNRVGVDSLTYQDTWSFFNDVNPGNIISDGILCCIQEMISPFYLVISKSFLHAWNNLDQDIKDEIISLEKLSELQSLVKIKTKAFNFAKKAFGADII